ncbi:MAG: hypothetical protein LQ343_000467 [Gyalolechia ehrenbergii]|nr:MAG: hypothetical protein LQ343_000467 [Gyalolechia ehrenbergii]
MSNYCWTQADGRVRTFMPNTPEVFVPHNLPANLKSDIDYIWATSSGFPHVTAGTSDRIYFLDDHIRESVTNAWEDGVFDDDNRLTVLAPQVSRSVQYILEDYANMTGWEDFPGDNENLRLKFEYEKGYRRRYVEMYAVKHKQLAIRQLRDHIRKTLG